ncbi:unnamed protein product [Polarella glacialis]|uniref:Uncharacterized protein n=1 Tax=Polarella glacialis TaxID=89957 RepID=A0A813JRQ9_POLGL|nr:unnamed protein product [Polarella glacialis]
MPPKLHKVFDPEFLSFRKDISASQLAAAEGDLTRVMEELQADSRLLNMINRDGNTMLLLAVANEQAHVADFLLKAKADLSVQNLFKMDAIDYATKDSLRTPIARVVLSACDYVIPPAFDGPMWQLCDRALMNLKEDKTRVIKTSLIGPIPDFAVASKTSEYKSQWIKNLLYLAHTVQHGYLMLSSDFAYLERDAILTGALEIPADYRFVYQVDERKVHPFAWAMRKVWAEDLEARFIAASNGGNTMGVMALLRARASPNAEDANGKTALMHASQVGDPHVLRMLIQAGAKVNAVNRHGYSSFLIAAVSGQEDAVRLLLKAQADLGLKSFKGNTVLDFVKHEGHRNILDIICQRWRQEEEAGIFQFHRWWDEISEAMVKMARVTFQSHSHRSRLRLQPQAPVVASCTYLAVSCLFR